jgi:hypothetical protein
MLGVETIIADIAGITQEATQFEGRIAVYSGDGKSRCHYDSQNVSNEQFGL